MEGVELDESRASLDPLLGMGVRLRGLGTGQVAADCLADGGGQGEPAVANGCDEPEAAAGFLVGFGLAAAREDRAGVVHLDVEAAGFVFHDEGGGGALADVLDDVGGELGDSELGVVGDSRGAPGGELAVDEAAEACDGSGFGFERQDAVSAEGGG